MFKQMVVDNLMLQLFQFTPGTPDQPVENETKSVGYKAEIGTVKLPEDTFRLMRLQFFETKHFFAPTILIFAMELHLYALLCSNCEDDSRLLEI